jgi:hypothetical protein
MTPPAGKRGRIKGAALSPVKGWTGRRCAREVKFDAGVTCGLSEVICDH